jgi:hypothetical protein
MQFFRSWRARTRQIARARQAARRAFAVAEAPPVLVYQMGKVGSMTVYESLRAAGGPHPLFHLHFISDDIARYRREMLAAGLAQPPIELDLGEALNGELRRNATRRCLVITLVRDPIAFMISDLFENPTFAKQTITRPDGAIDAQLAAAYLTELAEQPTTFDYVFEWFDRELKTVLDVDVFATPFPSAQGYARLGNARADVLLMRTEDLSRVGPPAIADLLGLPAPLKLVDVNVRKDPAYAWVRDHCRLRRARLEQIYASRFMRHFYSAAEIEAFTCKWAGDALGRAMVSEPLKRSGQR